MTSMTQDFKKILNFFLIFPYYSLILKSYHIILKLTAPIGLKKLSVDHRQSFQRKA